MLAFVNTLLTPACALATWFVLDLLRSRQVTAIGAATAIVVGCVGITPAAGFISPLWAMVLGVVATLPSYAVVMYRTRTRVDETLDVLAAHGVAGLTGHALHRLLRARRRGTASPTASSTATPASSARRLLAVLAAPAYAFGGDVRAAEADRAVMPLRATEREEALGMDIVSHGEEAYATGEGALLVDAPGAGPEAAPHAGAGAGLTGITRCECGRLGHTRYEGEPSGFFFEFGLVALARPGLRAEAALGLAER